MTVLGVSACATPTVSNAPDKTAAPAAAAASEAAPKIAKLGDAITVKGNTEGSQIQVTLLKVVNPAKGGEFDTPEAGQQYAAAQFRLKNTGKVAYSDSPSNGAKVLDAAGQQYESRIVTKISAGPLLPSSTKLTPGSSALGYIAFQIPKGTKLTGVQFGMDSGFADTGEWKL